MKTIAYIGWLGRRNLGDEACFIAIKNLLKRYTKEYKIVPWDAGEWPHKEYPKLCILGGGTLLDIRYGRRERDLLMPMLNRSVPTIIWGSGIVDLHGAKINPNVVKILNCCKFVGVRGPLSNKVLCDRGFFDATIVGDPGLFVPTMGNKSHTNTRSIAINVGYTNNNLYGTEKGIISKCTSLIKNLHRLDYNISLFSMWPKDNKMLNIIDDGCTNIPIKKCIVSKSKDVATELNNVRSFICRHSCVIGMKLHSCVLSAELGIPFMSLSYRKKCIDFVKSLGLNDWYFKTNIPWDAIIPNRIDQLLNNKKKISDIIERRISLYKTRQEQLAAYASTFL